MSGTVNLLELISGLPLADEKDNLLIAVKTPTATTFKQIALSAITGNATTTSEAVTLTQAVDFPYSIGTTKPKLIQVFSAAGDLLGFIRTISNGVYGILIPGTDAQIVEINVLY